MKASASFWSWISLEESFFAWLTCQSFVSLLVSHSAWEAFSWSIRHRHVCYLHSSKSKGLQGTQKPCCFWIHLLREDMGLKQTGDWRASNLAVVFITHGQPTKHAAALQRIPWLLQGMVAQRRPQLWSGSHGVSERLQRSGPNVLNSWLCPWSTVWADLRDSSMLWLPPFGKISLTTHYCPVVLGMTAAWCASSLVNICSDEYSYAKGTPKDNR